MRSVFESRSWSSLNNKIMIFAKHPDGKIYPAREMLEALEHYQEINRESFCAILTERVANNLQI